MVLTFCPFWQSLGFSADLDNFGSISIINCDQFWTFQDFWGLLGLLCLPLGFNNPFLKPTHPLNTFRHPKSWITTVGVNGGLFLVGAHRAATTPTHSCMLPPPPQEYFTTTDPAGTTWYCLIMERLKLAPASRSPKPQTTSRKRCLVATGRTPSHRGKREVVFVGSPGFGTQKSARQRLAHCNERPLAGWLGFESSELLWICG